MHTANRQKFEQLVKSIAHMNHVISCLESVGLTVDDSTFDGSLFKTFDGLVPQSLEYLNVNENYKLSEEIYNRIITVEIEDCDELIKELWNDYGI
jgi:hypothetical protein